MADDVAKASVDVSQLLAGVDQAIAATGKMGKRVKNDAAEIRKAINEIAESGGGLKELATLVDSLGQSRNSGYLKSLAEGLQKITAEATQAQAALEKIANTRGLTGFGTVGGKTAQVPGLTGFGTVGQSSKQQEAAIKKVQEQERAAILNRINSALRNGREATVAAQNLARAQAELAAAVKRQAAQAELDALKQRVLNAELQVALQRNVEAYNREQHATERRAAKENELIDRRNPDGTLRPALTNKLISDAQKQNALFDRRNSDGTLRPQLTNKLIADAQKQNEEFNRRNPDNTTRPPLTNALIKQAQAENEAFDKRHLAMLKEAHKLNDQFDRRNLDGTLRPKLTNALRDQAYKQNDDFNRRNPDGTVRPTLTNNLVKQAYKENEAFDKRHLDMLREAHRMNDQFDRRNLDGTLRPKLTNALRDEALSENVRRDRLNPNGTLRPVLSQRLIDQAIRENDAFNRQQSNPLLPLRPQLTPSLVDQARAQNDLFNRRNPDGSLRPLLNSNLINQAYAENRRQSGFVASARQGFIGDNAGRSIQGNLGHTFGQAAKFGVIYGSIYRVLEGVEKAFHEAFEQAVHFQKSVAELQFQTGQSASSAGHLANLLQSSATLYGESGGVGIEAGQKALGLYGATTAGQDVQDATAISAANVATKLAYVTGKPVDSLVEGLGSLTKSFHQGAESINAAADTVVRFSQIYHVNAADLAAAAPKLAPLSAELGFTQKQSVALEAATAARTGLSPSQAVSGIDTLLAKGLSGPLLGVLSSLGITNGSVKDQISRLAEIFVNPETSQSTREQILGAAGRGGTNRDVVTSILEVLGEKTKTGESFLTEAEKTDTSGSLDKFVEIIQQTLGGRLRELAGVFKQFAVDFSQTGLFDAIGAGVLVLERFVQGVDGLLRGFNKLEHFLLGPLPDSMERFVKAAVASAAALATANLLSGGALRARGTSAALLIGQRASLARTAAVEGGAGAIAARGAGLRAGAAGIGAAFGGIPALIGATVVGLGLFEKGLFDWKDKQEKANSSLRLLNEQVGKLTTSESVDGVVDTLEEYITTTRGNKGPLHIKARSANKDANIAQGILDNIKALTPKDQEKQAIDTSAAFGDFTPEKLAAGLQGLQDNGYTAFAALQKLNSAIKETGERSAEASPPLTTLARDVLVGVAGIDNSARISYTKKANDGGTRTFYDTIGAQDIKNDINQADLFGSLQAFAGKKGAKNSGDLTKDDLTEFSFDYSKLVSNKRFPNAKDADKASQYQQIVQLLLEDLMDRTVDGYVKAINGQTAAAAFQNIKANISVADSATFLPGDNDSQINTYVEAIKNSYEQINSTKEGGDPESLKGAFALIAQATGKAGQIQYQKAKAVFEASSKSNTDVKTAITNAQNNSNALLQGAVSSNDTTDITSLVANGGKKAAEYARTLIEANYNSEIAMAQLYYGNDPAKYAAAVAQIDNNKSAELQAVTAGLAQTASDVQLSAARAGRDVQQGNDVAAVAVALKKAGADLVDAGSSGNALQLINAQAAVNSQAYAFSQAVLRDAQENNTSKGALSGSPLAAAQASLKNAKLAMNADRDNITKFNKDLADYFEAARQVAQAAAESAHNRRELGIDSTNAVQQAQEDARTAADLLRRQTAVARDPKSPGGRRITSAEQDTLNPLIKDNQQKQANAYLTGINEQESHNSLLEAAGKISVQQQIRADKLLLKNVEDRLSHMKKTDEGYKALSDKALELQGTIKSLADSFNGQFNLGDINVPTVYDARRYAKSVAGGANGFSGPAGSGTTIQINGADTGAIIAILSQYMGSGNTYSVTGY